MSADLGLPPKHAALTRSYSSPDVHPHDQSHVKPRPPPYNHRSSSLPSSPPDSPKAVHEASPVDVFLGGSCNPTTWRRDIAIPLLEAANITCYKPQVDEWYEELIELESRAKDTASFVLFVIDNLTRSIVSMNDAAEFMCCGRRVVLVVEDMPLENVVLEGTTISAHEISDLNAAI
ncbi:unnamed protein product [Aphanomyces euteiches]|nr:hypothetical protein Ae201684P_020063 [Aphanomyces euteiches]KAH9101181.1 hypothetical protein Ae201684P_007366 [Aphanomyces euteiches]